jgi:hypothetical protein
MSTMATPESVMAGINNNESEVKAIVALWNSLIRHPLTEGRARIWNLRYGFGLVIAATKETGAKMLRKDMCAEHAFAFCGRVMTTRLQAQAGKIVAQQEERSESSCPQS